MTATFADAPTAIAAPRGAVIALALGAFAIGTGEFMISGLLQNVASDLDVSIPTAGLLIAGYAGGVALGGPPMSLVTGRLRRKQQILLLLAIFVAGNVICALAHSYWVLLTGRIVTSFCHGAFYGAASVAAANLVSPAYRARALALVSAGVMVANVVGVPLGTAIGQATGWRMAFWGVAGLGGLAGLTLALVLPARLAGGRFDLVAELRAVLRPQVLAGLALSLCFTIGWFTSFSYVTPLLTSVSGATPDLIPLLLMVFGVGATAGMLIGGRLADWRLRTAMTIAFAAQLAIYAVMILLSQHLVAMWAVLFVLGVACTMAVAPLRMIVLNGAGDAPMLASTMTSSAFNLGVAIGATIGAALTSAGIGYALFPVAGMVSAAVGLVFAHRLAK